MNPHAHISLCDQRWVIYHDSIEIELYSSVNKFLNLVFETFSPKGLVREAIENEMYQLVDDKEPALIYFKSGDIVYLWTICVKCNMFSMN